MRRSTTTGLRLEGKTMELEFDRDWIVVFVSSSASAMLKHENFDVLEETEREGESQLCLKSSRGERKLDGRRDSGSVADKTWTTMASVQSAWNGIYGLSRGIVGEI